MKGVMPMPLSAGPVRTVHPVETDEPFSAQVGSQCEHHGEGQGGNGNFAGHLHHAGA